MRCNTNAIPDYLGLGNTSNFSFTHNSWSKLLSEIETNHPSKRIIGWYHSHPGFTAFFSSTDINSHHTYFNQPWMVGLVVDPYKKQGVFYGNPTHKNTLEKIDGFYELPQNNSNNSYIRWVNWHNRSVSNIPEAETNRDIHDNNLYQANEESGGKSIYLPNKGIRRGIIFGVTALTLSLIMNIVGIIKISRIDNQFSAINNNLDILKYQYSLTPNQIQEIKGDTSVLKSEIISIKQDQIPPEIYNLVSSNVNHRLYIVKEGESFESIANKLGIVPEFIFVLNSYQTNPQDISPGDLLLIFYQSGDNLDDNNRSINR